MSLSDQQWSPTSVQVTVLQARGLRIKGKSGTNDAYAVMQVAKEKYQTSVAEKSVAPVWQEEAAFDLPAAGGGKERTTLHVHVLHRALVGPDKLLGQAVINLLQLSEDKSRSKTEWFKLLDKTGKPDKDRGEVLLDIQFMRNNMTSSMFDLSAAGKSRSRLGKLKDKVRGKKKESDSAPGVAPSFSQVLTDSEDEANGDGKNKKHKMKSLFSPKSNLQKTLSQSMSVLPAKNSSLSGSQSSGLNLDSSQGKKKFKFKIHKRSGSSDLKDSSSGQKQVPVEQSNLCINGSHIYCEEPPARTSRIGSNFSLTSSGHGSMEHIPENSPPAAESLRGGRQCSPWTEEEEEAAAKEENDEEDVDKSREQEEARSRMEEMKRKREEEEGRKRQEEFEKLAEEMTRQEQEKRRVEEEEYKREEEKARREEEVRAKREREAFEKKQEEERERTKLLERMQKEEEERIGLEEERKRIEEEERIKMEEEERIRKVEERKRIEEEERVKQEEKRKRIEEEERIKMEEEERIRMVEESKRIEKEERVKQEEKRKRFEEEEERKRIEEEERVKQEEKRKRFEERVKQEEERKRIEEEERVKQEEERKRFKEEERVKQEEERKRIEEEERVKQEEERKRFEEEERVKQEEERKRVGEEERVKQEEERKRIEEEERVKQEEERKRIEEEERVKQEEERMRVVEEKIRMEEEKKRAEEKMRIKREEERSRIETKERMQKEEEERIRLEVERKRIEEEERKQFEEKEIIRIEEERKRVEEERKRVEEEERVRVEESKRIEEDESIWLQEEKRVKMEAEMKRIEAEEERERKEVEMRVRRLKEIRLEKEERLKKEKMQKEEERIRREKEEDRVRKEEHERLAEEEIMREDQNRREEEERTRKEMMRVEQEKTKLKEEQEKRVGKEKGRAERENEETRLEKEKKEQSKKVAGRRTKLSVPEEIISTNPFDEDFSSNPFEETSSSDSGLRTASQQRCQSAVSSPGNDTEEKDLIGTQREKRPAPQPPGRNQPEKVFQTERHASTPHPLQINKHSRDRDIKTISVPPQRHVQSISPMARCPTDSRDACSLTESAKPAKRPAPSKPQAAEELPPKSTIPHGLETKQVHVYGLNPFEEDKDENELAVNDDTPVSGGTHSVVWPPPASQTDEHDAASLIKIKSSKVARAPPPPAKNDPTSSAAINQDTITENTGGTEPDKAANKIQTEAICSDQVEERPLQETNPTTVQNDSEAGVKKQGPPVTSRRLQPVKPLNAVEQPAVSPVQGGNDNKSPEIFSQDKTKHTDGGNKGPYSQLTQEELISLVVKQERLLSEREKKISDLEQYIDTLLVRVIEEQPSILMSLSSVKKPV